MVVRRRLGSFIAGCLASRAWRHLRHLPSEVRHRVHRGRRVVEFFHQVDDPHSHLALQCLTGLRDSYEVDLDVHLVPPPAFGGHPPAETYQRWARRDAADVAPEYGLAFANPGRQPSLDRVRLARRTLSAGLDRPGFPERALAVGTALWREDDAALEALAASHGADPDATARAREAHGDERRRRLGHYAGGMFHFGGEWYWGVDRLLHLEARLTALGATRGAKPPLMPRPALQWPRGLEHAGRVQVECFVSLRSPYSAILLRRLLDWVDATGVRLLLRPVMPMVARGVPLSRAKGFYILADAAREAHRCGGRFGWLVDPLGEPVERALSLWPWAAEQGQGERYLLSCLEGAWADGIDLGSERGLMRVVERCNLSWAGARSRLGTDDWRPLVEENGRELANTGLWGVPAFRVSGPDHAAGSWSAWGQDRLWRVTQEVARRADLAAGKTGNVSENERK